MDLLSLGFSEKYGKHLLSKWRKQQIKLIYLYYFKQNRFEQKRKKTDRKKQELINLLSAGFKINLISWPIPPYFSFSLFCPAD